MTNLISCDFFWKSPIRLRLILHTSRILDRPNIKIIFSKFRFKYLEVKYWTYWNVFHKYFTRGLYLIDPPISCYFFWKFCFKYLEAKNWTCWSTFEKYFTLGPYLMDQVSCDFFSKVCFKYLETNIRHIGWCLRYTSYNDHIWWIRFHETVFRRSS